MKTLKEQIKLHKQEKKVETYKEEKKEDYAFNKDVVDESGSYKV